MRRILTAATLIALMSASGCSGDEPTAEPSVTIAPTSPAVATTSAAPRAADEYDGAQRLVGALNEAGIACLNWERTENPTGARERGSCYVGTEEIVASIYDDRGQADAEPEAKAELLAGVDDVDMIVGGNWTLSCDSQVLCEQIERDFGGEHIHIPA